MDGRVFELRGHSMPPSSISVSRLLLHLLHMQQVASAGRLLRGRACPAPSPRRARTRSALGGRWSSTAATRRPAWWAWPSSTGPAAAPPVPTSPGSAQDGGGAVRTVKGLCAAGCGRLQSLLLGRSRLCSSTLFCSAALFTMISRMRARAPHTHTPDARLLLARNAFGGWGRGRTRGCGVSLHASRSLRGASEKNPLPHPTQSRLRRACCTVLPSLRIAGTAYHAPIAPAAPSRRERSR